VARLPRDWNEGESGDLRLWGFWGVLLLLVLGAD